ncbi:ankyrin repeat domain-containing 28 [Fusarium longipes]|uniref:Ankyrin repeat domain-containing 28 n=1 Tax=Fusarium longipes TaxID=694270 RepID=A0A395SMC3_9HYPO|nr:ankyrin repeat domain-containing 28 [Fusarium longipes]
MSCLSLLSLLFFMPCSAMALFGASNETDFWDDFANNFASDLAPVITLFGEQVTKQFLSQSTTILDIIIFSVGPLGILTAVVSCIRVSNVTFLKSVIGRAREPHGIPEVELCTSTSENVCELWSNGGICRVFGRPKILEFIYKKPTDPEAYRSTTDDSGIIIPPSCGIESTRDVFNGIHSGQEKEWRETSSTGLLSGCGMSNIGNGLRRNKLWRRSEGQPDVEQAGSEDRSNLSSSQHLGSSLDPNFTANDKEKQTKKQRSDNGKEEFAPFPNLALNIGVSKSSTESISLWAAAAVGVILQVSFFIFATWATQYNTSFYDGGKIPEDPTWFLLTIIGTTCTVIGMALCAQIIDCVSRERRFVRSAPAKSDMFWLQPAGQRIGDQEFDGFAYYEPKSEYITSWKPSRAAAGSQWRVWAAIMLTMLGWAMQFIGLRGVHGSVSLYQLGVTLFMLIIRSILRSYHTPPSNRLPRDAVGIAGHELDWQARELTDKHGQNSGESQCTHVEENFNGSNTGDLFFVDDRRTHENVSSTNSLYRNIGWLSPHDNVILLHDLEKELHPLGPRIVEWMESRDSSYWHNTNKDTALRDISCIDKSKPATLPNYLPQRAAEMVHIRSRLSFLTDQPYYQTWSGEVRDMSVRLKAVLQLTASRFDLPGLPFNSMVWSMGCHLSPHWRGSNHGATPLQQPLCFYMSCTGNTWNIDRYRLEAVLGLWSWSFKEWCRQKGKPQLGFKQCSVDPGSLDTMKTLLRRWGVRPGKYQTVSLHNSEQNNLSIPVMMCRSELAIRGEAITDGSGSKTIVIDSPASILNLMAQDILTLFLKRISLTLDNYKLLNILHPYLEGSKSLQVPLVDDLAKVLVSEGLATHEEAIMSIVPGFYRESTFREFGIPFELRFVSAANSLRRRDRFDEAERILQNLIGSGGHDIWLLVQKSVLETYRCQLRHMLNNPIADFVLAQAAAVEKVGSCRPIDKLQRQPLGMEILTQFQPDTPSFLFANTYAMAMTLKDRYDLGASERRVRKALLRWALLNDCTALVEDLWDSEQYLDSAESAFSGGPDELLWCVYSIDQEHIGTLLFLLNVVRVPATERFKENGQVEDESILDHRGLFGLQKSYHYFTCVLSAAAAFIDDSLIVKILAESVVWSPECLNEALLAAVEAEHLLTAAYLRSKMQS